MLTAYRDATMFKVMYGWDLFSPRHPSCGDLRSPAHALILVPVNHVEDPSVRYRTSRGDRGGGASRPHGTRFNGVNWQDIAEMLITSPDEARLRFDPESPSPTPDGPYDTE